MRVINNKIKKEYDVYIGDTITEIHGDLSFTVYKMYDAYTDEKLGYIILKYYNEDYKHILIHSEKEVNEIINEIKEKNDGVDKIYVTENAFYNKCNTVPVFNKLKNKYSRNKDSFIRRIKIKIIYFLFYEIIWKLADDATVLSSSMGEEYFNVPDDISNTKVEKFNFNIISSKKAREWNEKE